MRLNLKKIKKKFRYLLFPHSHNNFRSKLLHHDSLLKILIVLLVAQLIITGTARLKPRILGFASNIDTQTVLSLTNSKRRENGLSDLKLNNTLSQSASAKASHMFANNYWAHNAPDGTTPWYFFNSVGYKYLYAGENLARDFGDSSSVVDAWMNSPTHRENILSGRYDEIGIGVVNGLLNGQETTLVVQHFGKQASPQVAEAVQNEQNSVAKGEEKAAPEIALQEKVDKIVEEVQTTEAIQQPTYSNENITPAVSPLSLTKTLNIVFLSIIIITLFIDGYMIYNCKIQRRTGKNLVHLSLFILVILIILLTNSGKIA